MSEEDLILAKFLRLSRELDEKIISKCNEIVDWQDEHFYKENNTIILEITSSMFAILFFHANEMYLKGKFKKINDPFQKKLLDKRGIRQFLRCEIMQKLDQIQKKQP